MKPTLKTRLAVGSAAVLAAAAGAVAVQPTPAAAALPVCNTWKYANYAGSAWRVQLPAHGTSSDCILYLDDTGPGVEVLQLSLIYCNTADLSPYWIDGYYGPKTRNAVAWIQGANGKPPTGVYGPTARNVLVWLFRKGSDTACYPLT
jgi:peptidoglycan hydrolase-like protein with peptidoglycan-binding domain